MKILILALAVTLNLNTSSLNPAAAQTFSKIDYFLVGWKPAGALTKVGDDFYVACWEDSGGGGALLKIHVGSTTFGPGSMILHSFINADGSQPNGGLVVLNGTVFGTTFLGGAHGCGTVFAVGDDGNNFRLLHSFASNGPGFAPTNSDGVGLIGSVLVLSNFLYGVTASGGPAGQGVVFRVSTDGSDFSVLHHFTDNVTMATPPINGLSGSGSLVYSNGVIYGTSGINFTGGDGIVFRMNLDGTGYSVLHRINDGYFGGPLVLDGDTLYGETHTTVFKIGIDGSGFRVLHTFGNAAVMPAGLILIGKSLYGVASGGSFGNGILFKVDQDGTDFSILHEFGAYDGSDPCAGLVFFDNTLYGMTFSGGISDLGIDGGTRYSLLLQPALRSLSSAGNLILAWPTNFTGFTLEYTTNLDSPAWSTSSSEISVAGEQYKATNALSGPQRFFRLRQ
jgi:uncharacterized repeat protein (TIGR03803 family)